MPVQLQLPQILYLTGAVFLACSRAGHKHHTRDCSTEGTPKPKQNPGGGWTKVSVFHMERGEGTTGL